MDAKDRIQVKIKGLLAARNYVLNGKPSDIVVLTQLTEMIMDLNVRQIALSNKKTLRSISPGKAASLHAAVQTLNYSISQRAAASQVLIAAIELFSLHGDDPTKPI
jgi:hypothetical protein